MDRWLLLLLLVGLGCVVLGIIGLFAGWWPPHDAMDVVAWRLNRRATP
jgi:uncharacterized membrane protein YbaN (DUF454 family)